MKCQFSTENHVPCTCAFVVEKPVADTIPMWTREEAFQLCTEIENRISQIGFHVGLRGGLLFRNTSHHDLDLIIYPHDSTVYRVRELYEALCGLGLEQQKNVLQVHAGWRAKGSNDEKSVEIWKLDNRVIDIFYAGFGPYVGSLQKYFIWSCSNYRPGASRVDLEKYVAKYGQKRLDRHTIETTNPVTAAEMWVANYAKECCDYSA